jgi:hypothetical protein
MTAHNLQELATFRLCEDLMKLVEEAGYRRNYFSAEVSSELLQLCVPADKAARGLRRYLWSVKKSDLPPKPDRNTALNVAQNVRRRRRETRPQLRGNPRTIREELY